jgi:hypothetical protein
MTYKHRRNNKCQISELKSFVAHNFTLEPISLHKQNLFFCLMSNMHTLKSEINTKTITFMP